MAAKKTEKKQKKTCLLFGADVPFMFISSSASSCLRARCLHAVIRAGVRVLKENRG